MALSYNHVTVAGAGANSGADWANAMALSDFVTDLAIAAAGGVYFVKEGTYTLVADLTTLNDGTAADPIAIIGVLSGTTREGAAIDDADFATGANRPHFDGGASYGVQLDNYAQIHNISIQSEEYNPLRVDLYGTLRNCKADSDYGGASARYCIYLGGYGAKAVDCEALLSGLATNITGISMTNASGSSVLFCYIHDLTTGIPLGGGYSGAVLFSIFDNCTTGIVRTADNGGVVFGCTFYDCDTAISATTDTGVCYINNIFSNCLTYGISHSTATNNVLMMYNHFYSNGADFNGVPVEATGDDLFCDWWKTTGDPVFTTPGSDFSLGGASPCIDAGMAMALGVG